MSDRIEKMDSKFLISIIVTVTNIMSFILGKKKHAISYHMHQFFTEGFFGFNFFITSISYSIVSRKLRNIVLVL